MAVAERFPDRPYGCTCPELTWAMMTGRAPAPDRAACRAAAFPIDPHPVLEPNDLRDWLHPLDERSDE